MTREVKDKIDSNQVRNEYNRDAGAFASRAPGLLTWDHIGRPSFERHLARYFMKGNQVRALDVGSASGRVPQMMIDNGIPAKNIVGVELSPEQVEIARQKIPEAVFEVGNIVDFPLPQEEFDIVTCNMVLEFLDNESLGQALKNIHRSMKPDGAFVFISTHPKRVENRYGFLENHEGAFQTDVPWTSEKQTNYHRSINKYRQLAEEVGFKVETIEEIEMPQEVIDKHSEFNTFNAPARFLVVARKLETT